MILSRKIVLNILILLPILSVGILSLYQIQRQFADNVYRERVTAVTLASKLLPEKLNHVNEILETNYDITELKIARNALSKSQEAARLLVEQVKDYAIFTLDVYGCVLSWNIGAENIKGYKEKEILGKPLEVFYLKEYIDKSVPWRNLQMARELGTYEDIGLRVRKDGTTFWADVIFTALYDDEGLLRGYAKVTRDITERKQIEKDLHDSREMFQGLFYNIPVILGYISWQILTSAVLKQISI